MRVLCAILGVALIVGIASATPKKSEESDKSKLHVGVFDSRALVLAFAGSGTFEVELRNAREELKQAKTEGDEQRAREIEAEQKGRQDRFHRQGFSTAPVDDILEHIKDRLPDIAKEAGVDLIVSQWRIAYQKPTAKFVDVTDQLVKLFDPDEKTLDNIRELHKQEPLPLYQTDWKAMMEH
jgi:hypothetical protein